jgi:hypothetical protein
VENKQRYKAYKNDEGFKNQIDYLEKTFLGKS